MNIYIKSVVFAFLLALSFFSLAAVSTERILCAQEPVIKQPQAGASSAPQPQPMPPQPASAQPPAPAQPVVPAPAPTPAPTPAPAPAAPPAKPQQAITKGAAVNFNFDDADIFEVIQTVFGDILKVNYMIDPKVKGRVNFRTVTPVPKDQVLDYMDILLKMNDAGYIVDESGLYKIVPLESIPGTTAKVFVYPLQNGKAKHIASLLQSIFAGGAAPQPPAGFVPEAPRPGAPQPGQPPPAAASPAGSAAVNIGASGLLSRQTKVMPDETTNSLVVLAPPADYKFIEETIKKLDTPPRQVMIEVLIAEVTLTKDFQFGLEYVIQNAMSLRPFSRTINLNGPIGVNSNLLPSAASGGASSGFPGFSYAATDISGNVKALLNTLASDNKVTVLASPHILAADNLEAQIQIGNEVPIATSQLSSVASTSTTGTILSTIQYKDIGTILKVKPQINESGVVAMEVSQEVSDYSTQTVLGTTQYIFSKRAATTNLVARDGQTIVICGLIQDDRTKTMTGVPLLSSIPILGHLFSSTDDSTTKTEIIVLLTPHVIKNEKEAGNVTTDYLNRLTGTKDMNMDKFLKSDQQNKPENSNAK